MFRTQVFVFLTLSAVLTGGLPAGEAPVPEQLVRQLGSDDFDERQEAAEKLEALGETAREALEKARRSEVLEIRATAYRLLGKLKHAKLIVRIVDEDGKPWPKLSVTGGLHPIGQYGAYQQIQVWGGAGPFGNPNGTFETDDQGCIRLESPRPGPHSLALQWQDAQSRRSIWQPYALNLRSGENRVLWVRPRGATVKGTVVSAETGKPIADAEVLVRRDDGTRLSEVIEQWAAGRQPMTQCQGSADNKGAFSVEGVSPSVARVYARHADFAPAESASLMVTESRAHGVEQPIRLKPKASVWGRVRVQVLDGEGKPAKNAKVQVQLMPLGEEEGDENDMAAGMWMPWQRRLGRGQGPVLETDKEGWAQTEWMEPGPYRLVVTRTGTDQNDASRVVNHGEIQVKAGETVAIEGKSEPENGSLKGRLKTGDDMRSSPVRVFALQTDDPLVRKFLTGPNRMQTWMLYHLMGDNRNQQYIHSNKDDFELPNLTPGEYALAVQSMRDQRLGWVFGLDVKAGKATTVPEIDLSALDDAEDQSLPKILRGVLVGEKGKQPQSVQWKVSGPGYSSSSSTNGRNFQINLQNNRRPTRLTFTCPGYRPYTIDLRKPITDPENMTIRLEPQGYGSVLVTVRDPEGRPLEDARVTPISAVRRAPSLERSRDTDIDGHAKLSGLAYGKRQVVASLDGYYLEEPVIVVVELDKTTELDVTLKPGKTLKGRVALPPGVRLTDALAWIACDERPLAYGQQEFWRSTSVDEEGRFQFTGLAPGKAKLRAQAPGLVSDEVDASMGADESVELHLTRPSSLIVELGEAGKGGTLWIMRSGTWKPTRDIYSLLRDSTPVSPDGRAIFSDLAPGTYDLVFAKRMPRNVQAGGRASLQVIASSLKVTGDKGAATVPVTWQPGTASLKLTLEPGEGEGDDMSIAQSTLLIQSDKAFALVQTGQPGSAAQAKPWFIRGTPPEGFLLDEKAACITVPDLPAGEYKLHFHATTHTARRGLMAQDDPELLKTFSLKDGETLDLGPIKLDRPDEPGTGAALSGEEIGEDKPLE